MRSEFEETRTFKSIYSTLMYFDEDLDLYTSKEKWREEDAWRLTYAWWAYKELQTKIDRKNETTKEGFALWFKTTSYFGAYFTDLDLTLNHRDQFENDIINSAWLAYQSRQTEVDELQKRVDLLEGKIKEALNTVYAMKGKADCDHLTDKEQSFVYGFGYELHEILKEEQALKGGGE